MLDPLILGEQPTPLKSVGRHSVHSVSALRPLRVEGQAAGQASGQAFASLLRQTQPGQVQGLRLVAAAALETSAKVKKKSKRLVYWYCFFFVFF